MFEKELVICIKMDLPWNPTNQPFMIFFPLAFLLFSLCRGPVDGGYTLDSDLKRFWLSLSIVFVENFFSCRYCLFLFNLGVKVILLEGFIIAGDTLVSVSVFWRCLICLRRCWILFCLCLVLHFNADCFKDL